MRELGRSVDGQHDSQITPYLTFSTRFETNDLYKNIVFLLKTPVMTSLVLRWLRYKLLF